MDAGLFVSVGKHVRGSGEPSDVPFLGGIWIMIIYISVCWPTELCTIIMVLSTEEVQ
jgi:hypothetical protein